MKFSIILAETPQHGIGNSAKLPWSIPRELQYFQEVTKDSTLIMDSYSKLKGCIITRNPTEPWHYSSLSECLTFCDHSKKIFVIGGARLYNEAMYYPNCHEILLTSIHFEYPCDVYWKGIDDRLFVEDLSYRKRFDDFTIRRFVKHPELQYVNLIKEILATGSPQIDRTQVGTLSLFGRSMRFDLSLGFPLFTTKHTFFKGVKEELLWFLSGSTNAKDLAKKGVHIWDDNGSREFLDKRGLSHYEEMELGPVYGYQWRHFGARYPDKFGGIDQIRQIIDEIRTNPASRRLIVSAWNPVDLEKMALPPCHVLFQFSIDRPEGESIEPQNSADSIGKSGPASGARLSLQLYQRSADLGLGVPFNVASYALLLSMVAQVCNLIPGELIIVFGNAHIYQNHIIGLQELILRNPMKFCRLVLNPAITDIDHFRSEDISVEDYRAHPAIKLKMAV